MYLKIAKIVIDKYKVRIVQIEIVNYIYLINVRVLQEIYQERLFPTSSVMYLLI